MNIESRKQLFNQNNNNTAIKLWSYPTRGLKAASISSNPGFQQLPNAGKKSMATSTIEPRRFYLDGNLLYYSKTTNSVIKGCLDLDLMYMMQYKLEAGEEGEGDFSHVILL